MKFKTYLFRNNKTKEIAIVAADNVTDAMKLMKELIPDILVTGLSELGAEYNTENPKHKTGLILFTSYEIKL